METILSIAGKPGLYRLVSRGKMNLIVESLDEARHRMPAFASDRVTSLADIAMYTDSDDVPLWQVLESLGEKEEKKECGLNYKKCSKEELHAFFAEVLPNYDRDRVHDGDIKYRRPQGGIILSAVRFRLRHLKMPAIRYTGMHEF